MDEEKFEELLYEALKLANDSFSTHLNRSVEKERALEYCQERLEIISGRDF